MHRLEKVLVKVNFRECKIIHLPTIPCRFPKCPEWTSSHTTLLDAGEGGASELPRSSSSSSVVLFSARSHSWLSGWVSYDSHYPWGVTCAPKTTCFSGATVSLNPPWLFHRVSESICSSVNSSFPWSSGHLQAINYDDHRIGITIMENGLIISTKTEQVHT